MTILRPMRLWFDTEFIDDGHTIDLISIGIVREDGATYYAESVEADLAKAGPWVLENVVPKLRGPTLARTAIRDQIAAFAGPKPEWWAWYGAYDWVALCQLFGRMLDTPHGWPGHYMDVRQLKAQMPAVKLPEKPTGVHDALVDAQWTRDAWAALAQPPSARSSTA